MIVGTLNADNLGVVLAAMFAVQLLELVLLLVLVWNQARDRADR